MADTQNKTQPTDADVTGFPDGGGARDAAAGRARARRAVPPGHRLDAAHVGAVDGGLRAVSLPLRYRAGGRFLATGFSPRKANLSIYIMPGYQDYGAILKRLGKHKTGKACLYINKLADVDIDVLEELIRAGLKDLGATHDVIAT
jgi:hypothetical protein